jgi:bacteriorhodopsin
MSTTNPTQITACVLFFVFIFYFMARKQYLVSAICAVAFASYVAMNMDVGILYGKDQQQKDYVARYVDWSITTPLLLLTLLRACRIQNPSVYVLVLTLDVMMIYMGYLGATTDHTEKRDAFFGVSCVFYVVLFALVFWWCAKIHLGLCFFLFFAWMVYPVLWYLHREPDPRPYLSNDKYNACVAALDVFSKVGYGMLLPL